MVNDAVIPMAAVGIKYFGGPVVTILASKTSRMYTHARYSLSSVIIWVIVVLKRTIVVKDD